MAGLAEEIDGASRGVLAPPIVPVDRDRPLPLSYAQQRLWFLAQLAPGSVEYNAPMPFRWRGPLDLERLAGALRSLVARHEVLRTRLVTGADGVAHQVIDPPPADVTVPVTDVSGEADPHAAAERLVAADMQCRSTWRPVR